MAMISRINRIIGANGIGLFRKRFAVPKLHRAAVSFLTLSLGISTPSLADVCSQLNDYSGTKFALVFGNNEYGDEVRSLTNAVQDARDVAEALVQAKFSVRCLLNAKKDQAESEIQRAKAHAETLQDNKAIKKEDIRLVFYFAGHGVRTDTKDKIILSARGRGVDVEANDSIAVDTGIRHHLTFYDKIHPLIVIDACRDSSFLPNPVPSNQSNEWNINSTPPGNSGFWIQYSTTKGSLAQDLSPRFAPIFVAHLGKYGKSIQNLSLDVQEELNVKSFEKQRPVANEASRSLMRQLVKSVNPSCDDLAETIWNGNLCVQRCQWQRFGNEGKFDQMFEECRGKLQNAYDGTVADEFFNKFKSVRDSCGNCVQMATLLALLSPSPFSPGEPYAGLSAKRLSSQVARYQPTYMNRMGTEVFDLKGLKVRESKSPTVEKAYRLPFQTLPAGETQIDVSANTKLQRLPSENSETATILKAGETVRVDCETLRCTDDWLGVRARAPDGDTIRGFVPIVQVVSPEIAVSYEGEGSVVDAVSHAKLASFIRKLPEKERETLSVQISARVLVRIESMGVDWNDQFSLAASRAASLVEFFKFHGFKNVRGNSFFEARETDKPAAVVELANTRVVTMALQ